MTAVISLLSTLYDLRHGFCFFPCIDLSQQQNIYDSIRKREIVMPEEHTGQLGFEYAWKELLQRSRQAG